MTTEYVTIKDLQAAVARIIAAENALAAAQRDLKALGLARIRQGATIVDTAALCGVSRRRVYEWQAGG